MKLMREMAHPIFLVALIASGCLIPVPSSALVVVPGSAGGQTDLGVVTLGAASGNKFQTFGNDGNGVNASLTDPGNGYPTFGGIALVPGGSLAGPFAPLGLFSPPAATANGQFGNVADGIGGGITAFPLNGRGAGGGIAWFPYLLDDGNRAGSASAVYSFYSANLQNQTNTTFLNVPGFFILGLQGTIPNGSFVAASIRGSIGGVVQDVTFASTGGAGPAGFCNNVTFVATNTGISDCFSANVAGGTFFQAFGVSAVGPFDLLPSGMINVNATVSLLADPGAEIEFAALPPDILSRLPTDFIGAEAAAVPEPSTWLLLGSGLVGLVIWQLQKKRNLMKSTIRYLILVALGLCTIAGLAHAVTIEPNFTKEPDPSVAGNITDFVSGPGVTRRFLVEPEGFGSIKNNTELTIDDFTFKIISPAGATWADVDGDGKIGTPAGGLFTTSTLSTDGTSLTLTGGTIPPGSAFKPLFKTNPATDADIRVEASYSVVPEPSTWLLLGSGLVSLVIWRRYADD